MAFPCGKTASARACVSGMDANILQNLSENPSLGQLLVQ